MLFDSSNDNDNDDELYNKRKVTQESTPVETMSNQTAKVSLLN